MRDDILDSAFSVSEDPKITRDAATVDQAEPPDTASIDADSQAADQESNALKTVNPIQLHELDSDNAAEPDKTATLAIPPAILNGIAVALSVKLGSVSMNLNALYKLRAGQIITLDREVGDALEVIVNDQVIAKCEIVVVDYNYAIRITELVSPVS